MAGFVHIWPKVGLKQPSNFISTFEVATSNVDYLLTVCVYISVCMHRVSLFFTEFLLHIWSSFYAQLPSIVLIVNRAK